MDFATLAAIFTAGFVVMTPVGPVSSMCIRRALVYGPRAGIAAGAGDAVAVAIYASIGVTGSGLLPHLLAPYTAAWHVVVSVVLVAVAIIMWRARPALSKSASLSRARLMSGFGAALAIALANPADIVLFAALFAALGIVVRTPFEHVLFFVSFFGGGTAYWIALSLFLNRWRAALTPTRVMWMNRTCSGFMLIGAVASLVSLTRSTS